jgi:hypothetical protein
MYNTIFRFSEVKNNKIKQIVALDFGGCFFWIFIVENIRPNLHKKKKKR